MIRVCGLFEGIGGFRHGLEQASNELQFVFSNDNDKHACQVYRYNFGQDSIRECDIRTVPTESIPDHDVLTAGNPCVAFSLAGKRQGFQDIRGTLFYEVVRIARAKRPRVIFLENVKGMLSTPANLSTGFYRATEGTGEGEITDDCGRVKDEPERGWEEITIPVCQGYVFSEILFALQSMGYGFTEWQVANSKYFGVPQNRERVFLVGYSGAEPARQVFPIGQPAQGSLETRGEAEGKGKQFPIANTLSSRYWKDGSENLIFQQHSHSGDGDKGRGFRQYEHIVPTLTGQMGTGGNNVPIVLSPRVDQVLLDNLGGNIKERIHEADVAWTLGGSKTGILEGKKLRKLMPVECERLQAFPDNWTAKGLTVGGKVVSISDNHRYHMLGNAVTTSVISYIGGRILRCL